MKSKVRDLKTVKQDWFRKEKDIKMLCYLGAVVFGVANFFTLYE